MPFIYLASPYSHPNPQVRRQRYLQTAKFCATIAEEGNVFLFSPIVHWHDIVASFDLPETADYWIRYNRCMQRAAYKLWVLQLDGWRESIGVQKEIELAETLEQPVEYHDPADD